MADQYLVVGAGFTGAVVAEQIAARTNSTVLVVDCRDHVAGNAHDARDPGGLLYHVYGPHIFHTNADRIWQYLSGFTGWRPYEHRVLGLIDGRHVPIPFNLTSLDILFPVGEATALRDMLIATYGYGSRVPIQQLMRADDRRIGDLARYIYERVFLGYTVKQWGVDPTALSPSVLARVPVHVSYDDRYFQDTYQAIPTDGYTAMIGRMLDHPAIAVSLATDFRDLGPIDRYRAVVYTGQIDEFFDYTYGPLPYRSLHFDMRVYSQRQHQLVGQVNYPNDQDFTRITEMSHLTGEWSDRTLVAVEYPRQHVPGKTIPYYPVPNDDNNDLHRRYVELAKAEAPNVVFAGRLGEYRYYNMDQAVAAALVTAKKVLEKR